MVCSIDLRKMLR